MKLNTPLSEMCSFPNRTCTLQCIRLSNRANLTKPLTTQIFNLIILTSHVFIIFFILLFYNQNIGTFGLLLLLFFYLYVNVYIILFVCFFRIDLCNCRLTSFLQNLACLDHLRMCENLMPILILQL